MNTTDDPLDSYNVKLSDMPRPDNTFVIDTTPAATLGNLSMASAQRVPPDGRGTQVVGEVSGDQSTWTA
jgi:hypothetical protein